MMTMQRAQPGPGGLPIGRNPLASLLKPEELSRGKACRKFKRGQIIFFEGQRPGGLYWIKEGKVKLYKTGPDGRAQITQLLNAGDVMGYRELFCNDLYTISGSALEDTLIFTIPPIEFFQMLEQKPALLLNLAKALSNDLKSTELRMVNLAQRTVRERLAEALLAIRDVYGYADDRVINVNLSREDLASIVGTATETVIRLLSDMKKEQIISTLGKKIRLLDERKLIKAQYSYG